MEAGLGHEPIRPSPPMALPAGPESPAAQPALPGPGALRGSVVVPERVSEPETPISVVSGIRGALIHRATITEGSESRVVEVPAEDRIPVRPPERDHDQARASLPPSSANPPRQALMGTERPEISPDKVAEQHQIPSRTLPPLSSGSSVPSRAPEEAPTPSSTEVVPLWEEDRPHSRQTESPGNRDRTKEIQPSPSPVAVGREVIAISSNQSVVLESGAEKTPTQTKEPDLSSAEAGSVSTKPEVQPSVVTTLGGVAVSQQTTADSNVKPKTEVASATSSPDVAAAPESPSTEPTESQAATLAGAGLNEPLTPPTDYGTQRPGGSEAAQDSSATKDKPEATRTEDDIFRDLVDEALNRIREGKTAAEGAEPTVTPDPVDVSEPKVDASEPREEAPRASHENQEDRRWKPLTKRILMNPSGDGRTFVYASKIRSRPRASTVGDGSRSTQRRQAARESRGRRLLAGAARAVAAGVAATTAAAVRPTLSVEATGVVKVHGSKDMYRVQVVRHKHSLISILHLRPKKSHYDWVTVRAGNRQEAAIKAQNQRVRLFLRRL